MRAILGELKNIEDLMAELNKKYDYKEEWSKADTQKHIEFIERQRNLVGVGYGDVMTVHAASTMIDKILSIKIKSMFEDIKERLE